MSTSFLFPPSTALISLLSLPLLTAPSVSAHGHHNASSIDSSEPIDSMLWIHMILQTLVWGILFPLGMVLGLSRSRWHVPLQSLGGILTIGGVVLGHTHRGRQFPYTAHGTMAKIIMWVMALQFGLGIYLKLHINEKTVRPWAVRAHGVVGKTFPIIGWVQMLLGVVTALGYCMGGKLGQCLAHYIMGSAFIGYATFFLIMLHLGSAWLARTGRSQEFFDSTIIMLWGIVNTFTEHHDAWNKNWSHKDMQHTMMGVLWWTGGALGMFLSRGGRRSFVPAVIILMTGWGMSAHEQSLMISTKIHSMFGYSLMAAGIVRIIEICFVLRDGPSNSSNIRIFQYLPPYLLVLGGTLFMSATDEELRYADGLGIDHVTYAMFVFSLSFLLFLYITFLIHLYSNSGRNRTDAEAKETDDNGVKENGYQAIRIDDENLDHAIGEAESYELEEADTETVDRMDMDLRTDRPKKGSRTSLEGYERTNGNTSGRDAVDWL